MGKKDRIVRWFGVLLCVALLAAGCGKTPAEETEQVEKANVDE